ncbi:hypothetical protein [Butyrivibrio proteoclasticus]|nr:hypothetical protein [Butyrivibrio proteoclasticus]
MYNLSALMKLTGICIIRSRNEIFGKVNLVRANGWSGKETKVNNDRVSDLKLLISEYEEKLSSEMKMDKVSKEKYVLEKLRSFADIKAELRLIFSADMSYLAEDVNNLTIISGFLRS